MDADSKAVNKNKRVGSIMEPSSKRLHVEIRRSLSTVFGQQAQVLYTQETLEEICLAEIAQLAPSLLARKYLPNMSRNLRSRLYPMLSMLQLLIIERSYFDPAVAALRKKYAAAVQSMDRNVLLTMSEDDLVQALGITVDDTARWSYVYDCRDELAFLWRRAHVPSMKLSSELIDELYNRSRANSFNDQSESIDRGDELFCEFDHEGHTTYADNMTAGPRNSKSQLGAVIRKQSTGEKGHPAKKKPYMSLARYLVKTVSWASRLS